jgi:hypothetical protein
VTRVTSEAKLCKKYYFRYLRAALVYARKQSFPGKGPNHPGLFKYVGFVLVLYLCLLEGSVDAFAVNPEVDAVAAGRGVRQNVRILVRPKRAVIARHRDTAG